MKLRLLPSRLPAGTKALVRVDYNVPLKGLNSHRRVADTMRLERSLETLRQLMDQKATIILLSHLGRPKGQVNLEYSLRPVAEALADLIECPVTFCPETTIDRIASFVHQQPVGSIILLENIRFFEGEKKNDPVLAKKLAGLADIYVNEAFSAAHRSHMSIVGLPQYLPSYAGLSFNQEVQTLHQLMTKPKRPLVVIVGGAKISDKVGAVEHLAQIANVVLVGGGVANNFLAADGFDVANSYLQDAPVDMKQAGNNYVHFAQQLIHKNRTERVLKDDYIPLPKIIYPTDVLAAPSPTSKTSCVVELCGQNGSCKQSPKLMYLDIGPKTIRLFRDVILSAGTVFWNGPMGVFEQPGFSQGTAEIAKAIAKTSATTIIGGGDTIAAINQLGLTQRFDYVSAAGGAALAFLAGKTLPGVKPLVVNCIKSKKIVSI
ncbi:MAG: phosphoglycerate kinase [Patescibacteria group bacterium]|nr:phosphoglycerate kinase [Patescibacteria group bacterium]